MLIFLAFRFVNLFISTALKCHHHEVVNGPILNGTATRITSATRKMIGSLWIALLQSSRSKNKQEKGGKLCWWRLLWRKSTLLKDVWKITPWIRKNIVISIHIGAMHCNKRYKSDKWGNGSTWAWNYTIALWQYVGHNYVGLIEGGDGGLDAGNNNRTAPGPNRGVK